jgi:hypothetical protein
MSCTHDMLGECDMRGHVQVLITVELRNEWSEIIAIYVHSVAK